MDNDEGGGEVCEEGRDLQRRWGFSHTPEHPSLCIESSASHEFWDVLVAMPLPCSEALGNPHPCPHVKHKGVRHR